MWKDERGANLLDTGAAFYDSYECADGKCVAVGALEPQFFAVLKERLGLASGAARSGPARRADRRFPHAGRATIGARLLEGTDACFAPILSLAEAPAPSAQSPRARTFIEAGGVPSPPPPPVSPPLPRPPACPRKC